MNTNSKIIASFTDKFGDERHIHGTRHGLTLKRGTDTHNQKLSKAVSGYFGGRVREIRLSKGMTMEELCLRAALTTGSNAKNRIYEIEKNLRSIGVRFGTVYQIAMALEVGVCDLLPTVEQVRQMTGATFVLKQQLAVA